MANRAQFSIDSCPCMLWLCNMEFIKLFIDVRCRVGSLNFMALISGGRTKATETDLSWDILTFLTTRISNLHPPFRTLIGSHIMKRLVTCPPNPYLATIFTYELDSINKLIRIRVHQQTNRTTINVLFTNCKFICVFWFRQRNRFPCFTCTPHSLMDRCQVNRNFGLRTVHFRRELLRHWIGFPKQRINRKQITRPPPDASNTALKGRREAFVL